MKRHLLILSFLCLLIMPQTSWATTSQYPNPYRQTMWNNITDSVHTLGQSPEQANMTKKKLHAIRTQNRLHSISQAQMAKFYAKRQAWLKSQ